MIARRRQTQVALYLGSDALATAAAMLVAYWLRFTVRVVPVTKGVPPLEPYLRLAAVAALLWPVVFYFRGLYQPRRGRGRFEEALAVLVAVTLATLVLTAGLTFYRGFSYSRLALAIFAAADVVLVVAGRRAVSAVLRRIRLAGGNLQRVLIVGAGELGRQVAERLLAHRELGFEVVGFLDDDPGKQRRRFGGVPVLGTTSELERTVAERDVDQVVLALPLAAHHRTVRLIRRAAQLLVEIKVVPDLVQYYVLRAAVEDLDGLPVINLTHLPLEGWNRFVKRAFDLVGAALLLLLTAPLFPLIALLIKREDGGPVFYAQERMGLDGRRFRMWKFRSMRVDAEADGRPRWTRNRDPRVTRVGAFLRRTNLDELPQLLNVLRGDMSLVGPRPERPEFVERFRERYPQYMSRHRVRAGMTGWAQVQGLRGDTSIRKRIAADLFYIENWSLGLDLKILWLTLKGAVLGRT